MDPNYSLWVLVTRKKNPVRNGCARIPMKPDVGKVDNSKGKLVISRTRWDSMDDDTPQVSLEEDLLVNKAATTRENFVQQHHVMVIPEGESEGNKLPSQVKLMHSIKNDGTRGKASVTLKSKSFKNLGVRGSKALKRQLFNTLHRASSFKHSQSSLDGDTEMGSEPNASDRMGDLVQGQKYCSGERDNSANPSGSDRNIGMV